MRTIWNAIAIVAVGNLLALSGFLVFLRATDRLNIDRARAIRVMLAKTISQERREVEEARVREEEARLAAEREARERRAPLTALERLAARGEATAIDIERLERLKRETSDLQRQLAAQMDALAKERAQLDEDKRTFQSLVSAAQGKLRDEQFRKTIDVLASLKPAQAASLLSQMLSPGQGSNADAGTGQWTEDGITKVVEYLDAMEDQRPKVIAEFLKTDPALAAELLERLRRRAELAPVSRNAP
jgi:hypothetical protein